MALDCETQEYDFKFSTEQQIEFGGALEEGFFIPDLQVGTLVFDLNATEVDVDCETEFNLGVTTFFCTATILNEPFRVDKEEAKFVMVQHSSATNIDNRFLTQFVMKDVPLRARDFPGLCIGKPFQAEPAECVCNGVTCDASFKLGNFFFATVSEFYTLECIEEQEEGDANFFSGLVLYAGAGFLGLIAILLIFVIILKVQLGKEKKKKKNMLEAAEVGKLFDEKNVKVDIDSGNFSLFTGLTELQRRRSFGTEFSNIDSVKSEITAKDKANNRLVKSVVSKQESEITEAIEYILQLTPFVAEKNKGEMKKLVVNISKALEKEMVDEDLAENEEPLNKFNAEIVPNIEIEFYIQRLLLGLNFWYYDEEEYETGVRCLMFSLHYINKLKVEKNFKLSKRNIHKLLAITTLVSGKFTEDEVMSNDYWSSVCGMDTEEVNTLEEILCFSIGFEFTVSKAELDEVFAKHGLFHV